VSFDLHRVRFYEWLLAFFGAALIGVMFVRWYGLPHARHVDAWQAFSVTDVVLVACGGVAISVAVAAALHRTAAVPQALAAMATLAGLLATVLVVVRAASPPSLGGGPVTRDAGVWLGLVSAIGIGVCAWRSMADEHFPEVMRPHIDVERLELPTDDRPLPSR
jgi:hypothetical protein